MKQNHRRVAILLCSVALAAPSGSALAEARHHRQASDQQAAMQAESDSGMRDPRYPWLDGQSVTAAANENENGKVRRVRGRTVATPDARLAAQSHANSANGGPSTNELVAEARKYIGTNPTGRGSLWCAAFMDFVLRQTGHKGGGNLASGYAHYGTRVAGPQVGAIAVMGRHGGGHVGVVTGIDGNGNPIIVSGNHNHTVAESVYPRGRITAYVLPGG